MDNIYMFTFRNLKLLFAGLSLALLLEGTILFFASRKIIPWLQRMPPNHLRLVGIVEIILSLGLLYFVIYH